MSDPAVRLRNLRRREPAGGITTLSLLLIVSACGGDAAPAGPGSSGVEVGSGLVTCEPREEDDRFFPGLPPRAAPPGVTSGEVPHQQLNAESTPEVIDELFSRIFEASILDNRPSILGMQGTRAIWLSEEVPITRQECVPAGREFAHIYPNGSLHAVVPFGRLSGAVATGWAEPHPFAGQVRGFETFVMLFAPRSSGEVDVIVQLILESVDFITGG